MSKRILIYPYSIQSASAKLLKEALGAQYIKKQNSQYLPKYDDLVINWGSTGMPSYLPGRSLNRSMAVNRAIEKSTTLSVLSKEGVSTVPFTTDINQAKGWLNKGKTVVVRTSTTSSGGKGIEIYTPSRSLSEGSPAAANGEGHQGTWEWLKGLVASNLGHTELFYLPYAPLYTQLVEKEAEFRVHVGGSKSIHTQMKLRKDGVDKKDVWNHDNGYTFTSQLDGRIDPGVLNVVNAEGIKAVAALGLDFGAVDIGWSGNKPYVLEVNTAPGIEEPTLSKYVDYFKSI